MRSWIRLLALAALVAGAFVYRTRNAGPVDATALPQDSAGPQLRVAIMGDSSDPRIPVVREAIAHWNQEFLRLGRRVHFDSATIRGDSIPDEVLRGVSGEAVAGFLRARQNFRQIRLEPVVGQVTVRIDHWRLTIAE